MADDESNLRRRRPRRRKRARCSREGCSRARAIDKTHCTQVCQLLDCEFVRLEHVCRAAGPGTDSIEAWARLVEISDAWSEYVQVRGRVNHIAERALLPRGLPPPTPRPGRDAFLNEAGVVRGYDVA